MISEATQKKVREFKVKHPIYRIKYCEGNLAGIVTLIRPVKALHGAEMYMTKETYKALNRLCIL